MPDELRSCFSPQHLPNNVDDGSATEKHKYDDQGNLHKDATTAKRARVERVN
jgi:hypothetical protein